MTTKKWKFWLSVALVAACMCMATVLAGCEKDTPEPAPHEHNYTVWRHDDTEHWKECADLDGATTKKEPHSFADGKCACGFDDPRTFGSVAGKIVLVGGGPRDGYGDVSIHFGGDVSVGEIDVNGNFTATHVTVGKDYDVTVSCAGFNSYTALVRVDNEGETITLTKPFRLEYRRFDLWMGWDETAHDMSRVNAEPSVIGNSNKTLNVISRDTFDDVAVSLWMKKGNSAYVNGNSSDVQGIFVKFEDGKYMFLRCECASGSYKLQWAKDFNGNGNWAGKPTASVVARWIDFQQPLTQRQSTKFESNDGLKVTLCRKGNTLYTYVGDAFIQAGTVELPEEYGDDKIQYGFYAFDSKADAEWRFEADVNDYASPDTAAIANGTVQFDKTTYKYGDTATLTLTPDADHVIGRVTVCGETVNVDIADGGGSYSFAVTQPITVDVSFIPSNRPLASVTFQIPAEYNADGMQITLSRTDETDMIGTVLENKFTVNNVKPGFWQAKTSVYGVDVPLKDVYVGADNVMIDIGGVFESDNLIDFGNEKVHGGKRYESYGIDADISGDAYFAMKVQCPTDVSDLADNKVHFGLRLLYDNDQDRSIRFKNENGTFVLQEMNNWGKAMALPTDCLDALKGDGMYLVVHREASSGKLDMYCGTDKNNMRFLAGTFENGANDSHINIRKTSIKKFGAIFYGDAAYDATISDVMYGTSLASLGYAATAYQYTNDAYTANYKLNSEDITGDAYFAMKVQCPSDISGLAENKVHFGLRLIYENNVERTIRFHNLSGGTFVLQEMNNWGKAMALPTDCLDALKGGGMYLIVHRDVNTGKLDMYCGTDKNNMRFLAGTFADGDLNIRKSAIKEYGVMFERSNYDAKISEVAYGTSLEEIGYTATAYQYTNDAYETSYKLNSADITGDVCFAMKVQCPSDISGIANDKMHFGLKLKYGNDERTIRFKNDNGKFVLQEVNNWGTNATLSDSLTNALKGDGIYLVVQREKDSGKLNVYCGTSKDNMTVLVSNSNDTRKQNITECAVFFERAAYDAKISEVGIESTLVDLGFTVETNA